MSNQTKKVNKKKKFSLTRVILTVIVFAVSFYLLFSVFQEFKTTAELTRELKEVNAELAKIQEETKDLQERKEKLNDPEYIKSYARGEYSLTKEGEQIFHLPSSRDKIDETEDEEVEDSEEDNQ